MCDRLKLHRPTGGTIRPRPPSDDQQLRFFRHGRPASLADAIGMAACAIALTFAVIAAGLFGTWYLERSAALEECGHITCEAEP